MRFKRYIKERIQNPPMDFNKYIIVKLKQLDGIVKKAYKMLDIVKKADQDDDLRDFNRDATYDEYYPDSYLLEKLVKFVDADVLSLSHDLAQLRDYTKRIRKEKDEDKKFDLERTMEVTFKGLVNKLENEYEMEYIRKGIENIKLLKKHQKRIDRIYKDYMEYEPDKKYTEYYNYLKDIIPFFDNFLKWYEDLRSKMIEMRKSLWHDYKPEYGKVEELYHATMYAKEILKDGFQKKMPKERMGLGGAVKGISLTSDLKIAHDIARFFKEVIMIYKGKLKYRHIADWMRREGIDPKKWPMKKEPETVFDLARFYEYYLWMSKIRTVPVTGTWDVKKSLKAFSKRKESDVAILKCKVDMSNPEIEYVKGEREFRVPPEAIIGCKKL